MVQGSYLQQKQPSRLAPQGYAKSRLQDNRVKSRLQQGKTTNLLPAPSKSRLGVIPPRQPRAQKPAEASHLVVEPTSVHHLVEDTKHHIVEDNAHHLCESTHQLEVFEKLEGKTKYAAMVQKKSQLKKNKSMTELAARMELPPGLTLTMVEAASEEREIKSKEDLITWIRMCHDLKTRPLHEVLDLCCFGHHEIHLALECAGLWERPILNTETRAFPRNPSLHHRNDDVDVLIKFITDYRVGKLAVMAGELSLVEGLRRLNLPRGLIDICVHGDKDLPRTHSMDEAIEWMYTKHNAFNHLRSANGNNKVFNAKESDLLSMIAQEEKFMKEIKLAEKHKHDNDARKNAIQQKRQQQLKNEKRIRGNLNQSKQTRQQQLKNEKRIRGNLNQPKHFASQNSAGGAPRQSKSAAKKDARGSTEMRADQAREQERKFEEKMQERKEEEARLAAQQRAREGAEKERIRLAAQKENENERMREITAKREREQAEAARQQRKQEAAREAEEQQRKQAEERRRVQEQKQREAAQREQQKIQEQRKREAAAKARQAAMLGQQQQQQPVQQQQLTQQQLIMMQQQQAILMQQQRRAMMVQQQQAMMQQQQQALMQQHQQRVQQQQQQPRCHPLPPGWEQQWSQSNPPKRFYLNHDTQQTSWEDPRGMPTGWGVSQAANGKKFFMNHSTQSTTWDHPGGYPPYPGLLPKYGQ